MPNDHLFNAPVNFTGPVADALPRITKHISNSHAQHDELPGDFDIDPHCTIVGGYLNVVAAHPQIAALLLAWGWNGERLSTAPVSANNDELFLRQHKDGSRSLISILWDQGAELGFWGEQSGGVVVSSPPPPVADDPEHQHSAKLPPGWKRDVMYVEETCNTEIAKGIQKLEAEGVLDADEAQAAIRARLAAVLALHAQVEALPEDFNPGNPDNPPNTSGQAECDVLYHLIHAQRRLAARRRMRGYEPSAQGAHLGKDSFFDSQANEHLVNGLRAMSRVALALGLKGPESTHMLFGKLVKSRESEYVLGFLSWESQDPVMREFAGLPDSGGVHVGGN